MISEARLQQSCYMWFWNTYPELRGLLFAVPNGGSRNAREGKALKLTGVVSGVSDMLFMYNGTTTCFELKTEIGRQSINQQIWERKVRRECFEYHLIRDLETFKYWIKKIIN